MIKTQKSIIINRKEIGDNLLEFTTTKPQDFVFEPGQFISIKFEEKTWRAYSIASHPSEDHLLFIIQLVPNGKASSFWKKWQSQQEFEFIGPVGHFVLKKREKSETLHFFCTGSGIAPFRGMILSEQKTQNPRTIKVYYGGNNIEKIAYHGNFNFLNKNHIHLGLCENEIIKNPIEFTYIKKSWITEFIDKKNMLPIDHFYICGGKTIIESINTKLQEEIKTSNIFFERYN